MMKIKSMVFAFFVSLVACVTSPPPKQEPKKDGPSQALDPHQRSHFLTSVRENSAKGKSKQAVTQLKTWIQRHPADQEVYMLLGNIYFQEKKYKNAYTTFMSVSHKSPYINEARVKAIDCLLYLGSDHQDRAYHLLTQTLKTLKLSPKQRLHFYNLKIKLLEEFQNDPVEQIRAYLQRHQLLKDSPNDKLKAISLIESKLNQDDLQQMVRNRDFRILKSVILFRLGLLSFEQGDFRQAKRAFRRMMAFKPSENDKQKAKDLLIQIKARNKVNPYTIGVILPLSGEESVFGYKALRGLQLALGIYSHEKTKKNDLQLAVVDSESQPLIAKQAVQQLIMEDHVIAIVGSLMSRTAHVVASTAQKFLVPNISLSQKDDITQIGDYVFQNALTSQMQIEFLVETAMSLRGLRRFAVLYPNDQYGTQYTNLFWNAVLARGGQIVAAQSYTRDETDFRQQVQRLAGIFYKEDRKSEFEEKLKEWKEKHPHSRRGPPQNLLQPLIFFEALFIPDQVKVLGQIAPMLNYNDIENTTLLGTNLWNMPSLSERVGQFLKKPIFVDSFMASDDLFVTSQFYKDYVKTFAQKPHILEMQAFDTGLMLKRILQKGVKTREKMQNMMANMGQFQGALGPLEMTETRQMTRPMVALTYDEKNGQILPLSHSMSYSPSKEAFSNTSGK